MSKKKTESYTIPLNFEVSDNEEAKLSDIIGISYARAKELHEMMLAAFRTEFEKARDTNDGLDTTKALQTVSYEIQNENEALSIMVSFGQVRSEYIHMIDLMNESQGDLGALQELLETLREKEKETKKEKQS